MSLSSRSKEEGKIQQNIWDWFEKLCFAHGDEDAVQIVSEPEWPISETIATSLCYIEIQEYAKALASQLLYRYRPTYVLVDCHGWPGAELVALLACIRIQVPFVPVSCHNQHAAGGRLEAIVKQLLSGHPYGSIVAITCCKDDQDPVLGVFQNANVHSIVFVDESGNMREALPVPSDLPAILPSKDDIYVIFTSGTSGNTPKGVIGSHRSTLQRIHWFHRTFTQLPRVAKRTPLTFVDSISELLGTLLTPESVLVSLPGRSHIIQLMDIGSLVQETSGSQISILPSQLEQLLRYHQLSPESMSSLERIIISGEVCSERLWQDFRQRFYDNDVKEYRCQLLNLYGQTETSADCCFAVLTNLPPDQVVVNHTVTIGNPLRNDILIEGRVINDDTMMVELVVAGGNCLANGYLGQMDGGGGFVQDTAKERRLFQTGDNGFCKNGLWYVQGRIDDIVKINGEWTGPAAVESAFLDYYRQDQPVSRLPLVVASLVNNQILLLMEHYGESPSFEFSREKMKDRTKQPWNLIPYQVHSFPSIPKTPGTEKVDRAEVRKLLKGMDYRSGAVHPSKRNAAAVKTTGIEALQLLFLRIVGDILGIVGNDSIMSKSFTDLGGNSATAVSLHYELRLRWWPRYLEYTKATAGFNSCVVKLPFRVLCPFDILNASKVNDVWDTVIDERKKDSERAAKRVRQEHLGVPASIPPPSPATVWGNSHTSIDFGACVDITPAIVARKKSGNKIVAGCQNGVLLLVDHRMERVEVEKSSHLKGYSVSCDVLINDNTVFVCAKRHPGATKLSVGSQILALTSDLSDVLWSVDLSECNSLHSSPIAADSLLWIVGALSKDSEESHNVLTFDLKDGTRTENDHISLPARIHTTPLLVTGLRMKRRDRGIAETLLIYVSSDWETGLFLIDVERKELLLNQDCASLVFFAGKIGPVYSPMAADAQSSTIVVSDSWGKVHKINLETMSIVSKTIANCALSSPAFGLDSNIIVGSYSGTVYSLSNDLHATNWSIDVSGTIYTRPLVLSETNIVVICTTAGDIKAFNSATGKEEWRYRLPVGAEIWSDAVELPFHHLDSNRKHRYICFGARDSRLHFVKIPVVTSSKETSQVK